MVMYSFNQNVTYGALSTVDINTVVESCQLFILHCMTCSYWCKILRSSLHCIDVFTPLWEFRDANNC